MNANVAPFDAALPGALPALNARAVELAARLGFALGGDVQAVSGFDRKHYFYADLPHGFQITQQRSPLVLGGHLDVFVPSHAASAGKTKTTTSEDTNGDARQPRALRVERLQLEMDTGKSTGANGNTLVDLNRAGSTLIEIVTAPDLRGAEEAAAAAEAFQHVLRFLGVSDANMEEGSLRVDVNVSVRRHQTTGAETEEPEPLGERCEVKNLNSFRSIARAVRHEAARQRAILASGGAVTRQTRSFDPVSGETAVLREKESLLDYRFTPEPDVPPVILTAAQLADIKGSVPELPSAARARLCDPEGEHRLPPALARGVVALPSTLRYYDAALAACRRHVSDRGGGIEVNPIHVANWVVGELVGAAKRAGVVRGKEPLLGLPVAASAARCGELLARVAAGELTGRMAKRVLAAMLAGDARSIEDVVGDLFEGDGGGGGGVRGGVIGDDDGQLGEMCEDIVREMREQVTLYRSGKTRLMGLFVGEVMRRTGGRANPKEAAAIMKSLLDK